MLSDCAASLKQHTQAEGKIYNLSYFFQTHDMAWLGEFIKPFRLDLRDYHCVACAAWLDNAGHLGTEAGYAGHYSGQRRGESLLGGPKSGDIGYLFCPN